METVALGSKHTDLFGLPNVNKPSSINVKKKPYTFVSVTYQC